MKSWCIPHITHVFLKRMEAIIELYARNDDPQRPVVCFDEKTYQLLAHQRAPRPMTTGQPRRQDY